MNKRQQQRTPGTPGTPGTPNTPNTPNPAGRVDLLACRLLDRLITTHPQVSPFGLALYYSFKGDIETLAARSMGPRTKAGRTVKKLLTGSKQAGVLS
jgi:hypothetical protein